MVDSGSKFNPVRFLLRFKNSKKYPVGYRNLLETNFLGTKNMREKRKYSFCLNLVNI